MATTTVAKTNSTGDQRAQPNQSLYIQNLPEKLQKPDLRRSLYMLFATFGPVLDVTAVKSNKMRGQAHVLFRDVHAATQAMRACQGFEFYGREMVSRITFTHSKLYERHLLTVYQTENLLRQRKVPDPLQDDRPVRSPSSARPTSVASTACKQSAPTSGSWCSSWCRDWYSSSWNSSSWNSSSWSCAAAWGGQCA